MGSRDEVYCCLFRLEMKHLVRVRNEQGDGVRKSVEITV